MFKSLYTRVTPLSAFKEVENTKPPPPQKKEKKEKRGRKSEIAEIF
jgi:hypothetical protein